MRIASVNASVEGGGAERVALSLHESYLAKGHESWLVVGNPNGETPNRLLLDDDRYRTGWARLLRRGAAAAARRGSGAARDAWWYVDRVLRTLAQPVRYARVAHGREDFDHPATAHLLEALPSRPDVLHLHNLHGSYFDIQELPRLSAAVPSVFTMHDAWLLTGHCAHPLECERWLAGCDVCPHLDRYVPLMADASAENLRVKRSALRASALAFAAPSRWLLDMAERSGVLDTATDARVIPNGVDTKVFNPGHRAVARRSLGLPPDAAIIVTAGRDLPNNPYKGFDVLEDAIRHLAPTGASALVLAIGAEGATRRTAGVEMRFVPHVEDRLVLADYYRSADLYVHPARAEAQGLTIVEAMACGAPVIASRVGGIPEVVDDAETGMLFAAGDAGQLARLAMRLLADMPLRERLSRNALASVRTSFTLEGQVEAYLGWYAQLATGRLPHTPR
ncbi:MAG: glycosyltransferase [Coriobacteriia bacterium]